MPPVVLALVNMRKKKSSERELQCEYTGRKIKLSDASIEAKRTYENEPSRQ
jgi:hypothetical protein